MTSDADTILLAQAEATDDASDDYDYDDVPEEATDLDEDDIDLQVPYSDVETITVTGSSADGVVTDVADSVTKFDAQTIEALGAQDISDLADVTPNLDIVTGNATQASFFIRGVGLSDFSSNAAGAVAVFQDGVAVNTPPLQLGQLFDIANVEILRGPQSIGANRNASAGAIRAVSQKPTSEYSAALRATFGTWDPTTQGAYQGLIQDYEGAVQLPLYEDVLSTRISFRVREADPYKENGCGDAPPFADRIVRSSPTDVAGSICGERSFSMFPQGQVSRIPVGLPTRVGDESNWASRIQFRYQPDRFEMDWLLNGHGSRLSQQSTLGQAIGTGVLPGSTAGLGGVTSSLSVVAAYWEPDTREEWLSRCPTQTGCVGAISDDYRRTLAEDRPLDIRPYRGDYDRVGMTTLDTWGGFLTGDMVIKGLDVHTQTAFDAYQRTIDQDTDFTPHRLFETNNRDKAWQAWQEVSVSDELDSIDLTWNVGAYYLMEKLNVKARTILQFDVFELGRNYKQDTWSWAAWGSFSWTFLEDFTFDAGVRYNWERKDFDFTRFRPNLPTDTPVRSIQSATWDAPTGTVGLTYRFIDGLAASVKYSRGFKPGHFNAQAARPVDSEPARPEFVDSFEAKFSGGWFEERLTLAASFFFYLYEDYQIFLFTDTPGQPPIREIVNANDAQTYGTEVDMRARPLIGFVPEEMERLVIDMRFGWLDSQFIDFQNEVFRTDPLGRIIPVIADFTGNRLPNAPPFTLSGTVDWLFELGRWGSVAPRYDFAWTDDVFFDPNNGRGSPNFEGQPTLPPFAVGQPAYVLHNLRFTYIAPEGDWELAFWIRNITDTTYKNFAFDASQFQRVVINYVGEPRTFGVDFNFTF